MAAKDPFTNSLSRRRFLQLAGLTGAASILASSCSRAESDPSARRARGQAGWRNRCTRCAPATQAAQPKKGGTLNMSLGVDFNTFDPFFDVDLQQFKPMV